MPRLPRLSGREAAAVFERAGFAVRRRRGSHIILTRAGHPATLSVPDHEELIALPESSLPLAAGRLPVLLRRRPPGEDGPGDGAEGSVQQRHAPASGLNVRRYR